MSPVFLFLTIKGLLRYHRLPNNLSYRRTGLRLLQGKSNLLLQYILISFTTKSFFPNTKDFAGKLSL